MEAFHLLQRKISLQKQLPEVFWKIGVFRNFAKFAGKRLCQSLFFNKVAGYSPWKERLWHRCFHANFVKFLSTLFYTSGRLLLSFWEDRTFHYKVPFSLRHTLRSETIFCNWMWFKNDKKCFLIHLRSSFRSQDI